MNINEVIPPKSPRAPGSRNPSIRPWAREINSQQSPTTVTVEPKDSDEIRNSDELMDQPGSRTNFLEPVNRGRIGNIMKWRKEKRPSANNSQSNTPAATPENYYLTILDLISDNRREFATVLFDHIIQYLRQNDLEFDRNVYKDDPELSIFTKNGLDVRLRFGKTASLMAYQIVFPSAKEREMAEPWFKQNLKSIYSEIGPVDGQPKSNRLIVKDPKFAEKHFNIPKNLRDDEKIKLYSKISLSFLQLLDKVIKTTSEVTMKDPDTGEEKKEFDVKSSSRGYNLNDKKDRTPFSYYTRMANLIKTAYRGDRQDMLGRIANMADSEDRWITIGMTAAAHALLQQGAEFSKTTDSEEKDIDESKSKKKDPHKTLYREHAVPCKAIVIEACHMFKNGYNVGDVAKMIKRNLCIVLVTTAEANRLDAIHKTTMPIGWDGLEGHQLERFTAVNPPIAVYNIDTRKRLI